MKDSAEFLTKLQQWQKALGDKKAADELENSLREQLFKEAFPEEAAKEDSKGTFYEDLPNGWKLQAITKLTPTLDESAVPAIKEKLIEMKVANVDTLFKYKPSLVAAEFKKLTVEAKTVVNEAISEKPAKVALMLVPPPIPEAS